MIDRLRDFACALVALLVLGVAGASAQSAQSSTASDSAAAPQVASTKGAQAAAQAAGPAAVQINTAEITARANREAGVNIETTIAAWQHDLDRLDGELRGARLRYRSSMGCATSCSGFVRRSKSSRAIWRRRSRPQRRSLIRSGRHRRPGSRRRRSRPRSIAPSSATRSDCLPRVRPRSIRPICESINSSIPFRTFAERILPPVCSSLCPASTRTRPGRACRNTCPQQPTAFAI